MCDARGFDLTILVSSDDDLQPMSSLHNITCKSGSNVLAPLETFRIPEIRTYTAYRKRRGWRGADPYEAGLPGALACKARDLAQSGAAHSFNQLIDPHHAFHDSSLR